MMNRWPFVILTTLLLGAYTFPAQAVANAENQYEKQRNQFQSALNAVHKRHFKTFRRLRDQLRDYPLYPYLDYAYLRKTMRVSKDRNIENFLETYSDTPLNGRLRTLWLKELARRERWDTYLEQYRPRKSTRLRCHYAYALFKAGRDKAAMKETRDLWLVGYSQPPACDKTFETLEEKGGLTQSLIWHRAVLAMTNNKVSLAKYLQKKLEKESDRLWLDKWMAMHRRPLKTLKDPVLQHDMEVVRAIVQHGVKRIARRDEEKAWNLWNELKTRYVFPQSDIDELEQYLAMKATYRGHPKALEWLAGVKSLNHTAAQWRIRLAMRENQWVLVKRWITELPDELKRKEKWRYWYARSLQELGNENNDANYKREADALFHDLAKSRSYFGFLAADQAGVGYPLSMKAAEYDEAEMQRVGRQPGILRARELFFLGRYADARREWRYAIKPFKNWDLKIAAGLASRWGWHDRAIFTYARTTSPSRSKVDLPYPVAFRDTVMRHARLQRLDPAWIYGVLRQESAFMSDVRSHAGAMGLMQLMPGTARFVSRQTKTPLRRLRELLRPDKNIQLGSAYLRMLLDKHNGNAVLATTSYNAGGRRTLAWLPSRPMDADVWVETIPFTETRKYVGRVLAYTVIFDHLLDGQFVRIRDRMPAIGPTVAQN